MNSLRTTLVWAALLASCALAAAAPHGGTYRRPGPPPDPGTPGAGEANTGGPSTTGGGIKHTDPALWSQWWALSRDVYMPRAARVFDTGPRTRAGGGEEAEEEIEVALAAGERAPEELVRGLVVPAVLLELDEDADVDLLTAALMTLAKIGLPPDDGHPRDLVDTIAAFLDHDEQEVAESAAVALGVLGDRRGALLLAELLHDTREGRELTRERKVPERTRAYAAYGLAALGARSREESLRTYVAQHLVAELEEPRQVSVDLSVACIVGLGIVPLAPRGMPAEDEAASPSASREGQVLYLLSLLDERRFGEAEQSFVPVSATRLALGAGDALEELVATRLVELARLQAKVEEGVRAGAIVALGLVGDDDMDPRDVLIRARLDALRRDGVRLQRNLALLALGRVGGRQGAGVRAGADEEIRKDLLRHAAQGQSSEKPWAALALGLMEHGRLSWGADPDEGTREVLRRAFESVGNPSYSGALAVALGLCEHTETAPLLVEHLDTGDETIRGHAATGLGLMRARDAIEPLREIAGGGPPGIAREAAIALALCGDKEAWRALAEAVARPAALTRKLLDLLSLAYVGDGRAVVAPLQLLVEGEESDTVRAYAVVALGILCDKDRTPWNHALARDVAWWAAPPTLIDSQKGLGVVDLY